MAVEKGLSLDDEIQRLEKHLAEEFGSPVIRTTPPPRHRDPYNWYTEPPLRTDSDY